MRDEPCRIGGVPMKTAADLIVHPTQCHLLRRVSNHFEGLRIAGPNMSAKQKLQGHRWWKFRGTAKPSVYRIVTPDNPNVSGVKKLFFNGLSSCVCLA